MPRPSSTPTASLPMFRAAAGLALLASSATALVAAPDGGFQGAMSAAMERMHQGMMVPYTSDPDRDFAAMMIPHHEGAVEMAQLELRHGSNERLRRLAQAIIVEQRQEIGVMRRILAESGSKSRRGGR